MHRSRLQLGPQERLRVAGHSCAGQGSKARDRHAFVAVPAGLCEKIDDDSPKAA